MLIAARPPMMSRTAEVGTTEYPGEEGSREDGGSSGLDLSPSVEPSNRLLPRALREMSMPKPSYERHEELWWRCMETSGGT